MPRTSRIVAYPFLFAALGLLLSALPMPGAPAPHSLHTPALGLLCACIGALHLPGLPAYLRSAARLGAAANGAIVVATLHTAQPDASIKMTWFIVGLCMVRIAMMQHRPAQAAS